MSTLYAANPAALPGCEGCAGCGLLDAGQQSPKMEPTGESDPDLYILGEAPGASEDRCATQFVGASGRLLRGLLGSARCRWNNTVNCRPPNNRTPTQSEVACCRNRVEADIERSRPPVVLAVGDVALQWFTERVGVPKQRIGALRGLYFPARIGSHVFFVVPVLHPAYVLRQGGRLGMEPLRCGAYDALSHDVRLAQALACAVRKKRLIPYVEPQEDYYLGLRMVYDADTLRRVFDAHADVPAIAVDYETTGLRPYDADSRVLSVAIAFGDETVAVPVQHRGFADQADAVIALLRDYFSKRRLIAHNAFFEQEWSRLLFGDMVFGWDWADTQGNQYVLNNRSGTHSLDVSCFLAFGFSLKSLESVQRASDLEKMPIMDLLRYNALDAKYTHRLFHYQRAVLRRRGLNDTARFVVSLMPGVSACSSRGMMPDMACWEGLRKRYTVELESARDELRRMVSPWEKRHGRVFNLQSNADWFSYIEEYHAETWARITEQFGHSLDVEVLRAFREELPFADVLSRYREFDKLLGTYINPWPDYVSDDGRIHTQYNLYRTVTGRLSSERPNLQNQPKREHPELRGMVRAPEGCRIVAYDYGQIEARIIACASRDPEFLRFVRENQDVHMHWARRIVELHPDVLRGRTLKQFRSQVKNSLVFPAFYGASVKKISNLLGVPVAVGRRVYEEFWEMFSGIRQWQRGLETVYRKKFYVETLTGLRRYGPMSYNALVNTPIQGSAGHITIYMMRYFVDRALVTGNWHWVPVLNVHDDLTFYLPDDATGDEMELEIARAMANEPRKRFPWIIVPLEVEVSRGYNWAELKPVDVVVSDAST